MNKEQGDIYRVTQPKIYIFVTKHVFKILMISFLICSPSGIVLKLRSGAGFCEVFLPLLIYLIACGLLMDFIFKRIACSIIIDYNLKVVFFSLCRGEKNKAVRFSEIRKVRVGWYARFFLEDAKIYYNVPRDKAFNIAIERLKTYLNNE